MKFWSVTTLPASRAVPRLATIGLVVLAAMPASYSMADDAPKPAAAQPAATPEATAIKPEKLAQPVQPAKSESLAPNPDKISAVLKPKAKPAPAVGTAECVRTGQRVIAALARDDSGTASQFHNFYSAFKCSPQHLAQAFGCLVNLQLANPGLSNPPQEQVTQCWEDPAVIPKVHPQPGTDSAGEKH